MSVVAAPMSATRRRDLRRRARMYLGTTKDPAPEIRTALLALDAVSHIVKLASNGRYQVALMDMRRGPGGGVPSMYVQGTLSSVPGALMNLDKDDATMRERIYTLG